MCCCQNTLVQTVTVQFVLYVQCAQHYCNTNCVAVRTHRYRPSQYNLLCTFVGHNITVTHNINASIFKGKNPNIIIRFMSERPSFNAGYMIRYDVFLNYNWVDNRWQQYCTNLHKSSKQNKTMQQNTQNGTEHNNNKNS